MALDTRSLLVIGASSAGWAFSFGLGSQAVSHWLKHREINDTVIGFNHSFYYFGLAAASFLVPWLTRFIGTKPCAAIGMFGSAVTLLLFPFGDSEPYWYAFRFLNGCAGALSLIPLETVVSRDSSPERRTLNFGIYGVSLTLGGALGIALAPHLYTVLSDDISEAGFLFAFALASCPPVVGAVQVLYGLRLRSDAEAVAQTREPLGWGRNFLSYGTAWGQGFLEGGMIAFLALFLEHSRGFSNEFAGTLMSVTMLGVILFQVPVSWLGDRLGKTPVLLACYGVVIGGLAAIPWLTGTLSLVVTLFAFGACTGAMYPLGLSLLGEGIAESGLARAYAWYLAIECFGSQAGAAAMGKARQQWGSEAMFAVGLTAIAAVLVLWLAIVLIRRRFST
jgi:MFS family permease